MTNLHPARAARSSFPPGVPIRLFGTRAEIARPGADQNTALVLLDGMSDPTDRAAYDKEAEGATSRQPKPDGCGRQGKIDIGVTPDKAQPGFGGGDRQPVEFGRRLRERRQDSGRAWIAIGIERLAKPRKALAARRPSSRSMLRKARSAFILDE